MSTVQLTLVATCRFAPSNVIINILLHQCKSNTNCKNEMILTVAIEIRHTQWQNG